MFVYIEHVHNIEQYIYVGNIVTKTKGTDGQQLGKSVGEYTYTRTLRFWQSSVKYVSFPAPVSSRPPDGLILMSGNCPRLPFVCQLDDNNRVRDRERERERETTHTHIPLITFGRIISIGDPCTNSRVDSFRV